MQSFWCGFQSFLVLLPLVLPTAVSAHEQFTVARNEIGGVTIKMNGQPFATYVIDQGNKPFLWPVLGPDGKQMTRSFPMQDVPGETQDHYHHRGVNFGHQGMGGTDTWTEDGTWGDNPKRADQKARVGQISHDRYLTLTGGGTATVDTVGTALTRDGKPLLEVAQRFDFSCEAENRVIDIAVDLVASHGAIELDDMKDAGLSIRVPESIRVESKLGGEIVNSEGRRNADAWAKRANWVDYHGPIDGQTYGIAFMSHPSTFRHPSPWHVRTYGLFTANPFGLKSLGLQQESAAISLKANDRLSLRYRLLFHRGDEQQADIPGAFKAYAAVKPASPGQ